MNPQDSRPPGYTGRHRPSHKTRPAAQQTPADYPTLPEGWEIRSDTGMDRR